MGIREDMTDQVQVFAGTFHFDALKRKVGCNSLLHWVATFMLNYQKKHLSPIKKGERMVFALFCKGSQGARWRPLATYNCFPLKHLVKLCHQIRWQSSQGTQAPAFSKA